MNRERRIPFYTWRFLNGDDRAPGRVDTVQLTEKTDKGRALARPRKGSFCRDKFAERKGRRTTHSGASGSWGWMDLEQDLGGVAVKLLQGESQTGGRGICVPSDSEGGAERSAPGGVLPHRRPAQGRIAADSAAAEGNS